ncbi:MAG: glycosyltransferase [Candidatus Dormibacteria bacterium]|jgi:1,2-diacylglycerol 3-beta-galactosyltransferase
MPQPLLFLIADTGGGHRAAATAVARHLAERHPGEFDVHIVDPFVTAAPRVAGRTTGLYGPLIQHAPWLWGALFHTTNSRAMVRALDGSVLRAIDRSLARVIRATDPVAIVSFHPLLNRAADRVRRHLKVHVPLITVVTDLVDVHAFWAVPGVDLVIVPSPGGVDRCRRNHVPADRLVQIGLPVHPDFTSPTLSAEARTALRRKLGLGDPERFTVLICSGADGSGRLDHRAQVLARSGLDVSLVVIFGHNRHAQDRVRGLRDSSGRPVTVLGFVDNMAEWMAAADVIVTKAGPATISEALCAGLPLLITWFLPGQERGNVEWLVDAGAGRYVPGDTELVDEVAELAQPDSPTLAAMRAAVRHLARPQATASIGELIRSIALRSA